MEPGYYWAIVFGEKTIVKVCEFDATFQEQMMRTFDYGYQDVRNVEFISKEPLTDK